MKTLLTLKHFYLCKTYKCITPFLLAFEQYSLTSKYVFDPLGRYTINWLIFHRALVAECIEVSFFLIMFKQSNVWGERGGGQTATSLGIVVTRSKQFMKWFCKRSGAQVQITFLRIIKNHQRKDYGKKEKLWTVACTGLSPVLCVVWALSSW